MPKTSSPYYPIPDDDLTILDLLQIKDETLDQEINLLRSYIRRVTLRQGEAATVLDSAGLLRAVSLATFSLTQLIRANQNIKEARQPRLALQAQLDQLGRDFKAAQQAQTAAPPAASHPVTFTREPYQPPSPDRPYLPKFVQWTVP